MTQSVCELLFSAAQSARCAGAVLDTSLSMVQMAAMSQFSGGAADATASNMRTSQSPQQQHAQHAQHAQQQQQLEQSRMQQQQQQQQPEAQRLQHYRSLPGELSPADQVDTGGGLHLHQAPGSPNFASSRSLPGLHDFSDVRCTCRPCNRPWDRSSALHSRRLALLRLVTSVGHLACLHSPCRADIASALLRVYGRRSLCVICQQDAHQMMTDFQDFAHQVGLHTMDMSSPALPMPQLNRASPIASHATAPRQCCCSSVAKVPPDPCTLPLYNIHA